MKHTLSESGSLGWTELAAPPRRRHPSKWDNILCCDLQDHQNDVTGVKTFSLTGLSFFTATGLLFRTPLYTVPKPPSPSLLPPSDTARSSKLPVIWISSLYKKLEKPDKGHTENVILGNFNPIAFPIGIIFGASDYRITFCFSQSIKCQQHKTKAWIHPFI